MLVSVLVMFVSRVGDVVVSVLVMFVSRVCVMVVCLCW